MIDSVVLTSWKLGVQKFGSFGFACAIYLHLSAFCPKPSDSLSQELKFHSFNSTLVNNKPASAFAREVDASLCSFPRPRRVTESEIEPIDF